jgi:hypothetical protein
MFIGAAFAIPFVLLFLCLPVPLFVASVIVLIGVLGMGAEYCVYRIASLESRVASSNTPESEPGGDEHR